MSRLVIGLKTKNNFLKEMFWVKYLNKVMSTNSQACNLVKMPIMQTKEETPNTFKNLV